MGRVSDAEKVLTRAAQFIQDLMEIGVNRRGQYTSGEQLSAWESLLVLVGCDSVVNGMRQSARRHLEAASNDPDLNGDQRAKAHQLLWEYGFTDRALSDGPHEMPRADLERLRGEAIAQRYRQIKGEQT
jgi:hypothetical protein